MNATQLAKVERAATERQDAADADMALAVNEAIARAGLRLVSPGSPGDAVVFSADEVARGLELVKSGATDMQDFSDEDVRAFVAFAWTHGVLPARYTVSGTAV